MKFVNYKLTLKNDIITIPLDRPCRCDVGLVEITIPKIMSDKFWYLSHQAVCQNVIFLAKG